MKKFKISFQKKSFRSLEYNVFFLYSHFHPFYQKGEGWKLEKKKNKKKRKN